MHAYFDERLAPRNRRFAPAAKPIEKVFKANEHSNFQTAYFYPNFFFEDNPYRTTDCVDGKKTSSPGARKSPAVRKHRYYGLAASWRFS
jgi:hypothetical protein